MNKSPFMKTNKELFFAIVLMNEYSGHWWEKLESGVLGVHWNKNLELFVFSSRSVLLLPLMFTAFQTPIKLKCVCWITSKSWIEKSIYHNTNIHWSVSLCNVIIRSQYVEVFSGKFMDFLPHLFDSRVLLEREENQDQQAHLASRCCVLIVFWFFLID